MFVRGWLFGATLILVACLSVGRAAAAATASYAVTFDATWTALSHPGAYPANAHFSALIGGIHSDQVSFWTPGGLASGGIEQMAEVGGTSLLRGEVQAAINAGTALAVLPGIGIPSPGSTTSTFEVSSAFPLVTLVTMVAPTPDWFVGVHGLDLRDGPGWKNQVAVDLFAYDAGTEEGVGFSLSNPDTVPHQSIGLLTFPLSSTAPRLGTFTFTRLFPGRMIGDYNLDGVVDTADYVFWRDSSDQVGVNLQADGDLDGTIDLDDYNLWKSHFGQMVPVQAATQGASVVGSVPEPATGALAAIVGTFLLCRGRSRRGSGVFGE